MVTTRSKATTKPDTSTVPHKKSGKAESKPKKPIQKPSKQASAKTSPPKSIAKPKSPQKSLPKSKSPPKSPQSVASPTKSVPSKYSIYTPDQYVKFKQLEKDLDEKKLPDLKEMCRKNLMKVSGTKPELIERISDAKILGVIPKCPECGGGRPKLDVKTKTYHCSGYLEDVKFINCHKNFAYSEISRVTWQD